MIGPCWAGPETPEPPTAAASPACSRVQASSRPALRAQAGHSGQQRNLVSQSLPRAMTSLMPSRESKIALKIRRAKQRLRPARARLGQFEGALGQGPCLVHAQARDPRKGVQGSSILSVKLGGAGKALIFEHMSFYVQHFIQNSQFFPSFARSSLLLTPRLPNNWWWLGLLAWDHQRIIWQVKKVTLIGLTLSSALEHLTQPF